MALSIFSTKKSRLVWREGGREGERERERDREREREYYISLEERIDLLTMLISRFSPTDSLAGSISHDFRDSKIWVQRSPTHTVYSIPIESKLHPPRQCSTARSGADTTDQ